MNLQIATCVDRSPAGKGRSRLGIGPAVRVLQERGSRTLDRKSGRRSSSRRVVLKAAAKKGANAIIAKQKAGANGRKATAKASKRK
jgi:hypothetical protein